MLGKTHMAIGALGTVVVMPLFVHTNWITIPQALSHIKLVHSIPKISTPHNLITECECVAAALVGAIVPDFDEQHSLMAKRAERVVQFGILACLVWLVFLLKLAASLEAWVGVAVFGLLLISRANLMRKMALGLIACGTLYLAVSGHIPMVSGVLLSAWSLGAMLTGHRTFTHSIPGLAMFCVAISQIASLYHVPLVGTAVMVAYALHILADAVSGGVPLLWPVPGRVGVRWVKTGSKLDHAVSILASLAFLAYAVI